jgi:hypothetical protein
MCYNFFILTTELHGNFHRIFFSRNAAKPQRKYYYFFLCDLCASFVSLWLKKLINSIDQEKEKFSLIYKLFGYIIRVFVRISWKMTN